VTCTRKGGRRGPHGYGFVVDEYEIVWHGNANENAGGEEE